jgi:hypothetical protein
MSRHDFAIDPVREAFELESGGARFGGSFDDWGRRFLCNIRNPVQHVVLPARYLARNPTLAVRSTIHDAAAFGDQLPVYRISPLEPWRKVFDTAGCMACHRVGEIGQDVGPNLATIRAWSPEQILINILDPNREVTPNFIGYTVETRDGKTYFGEIAALV